MSKAKGKNKRELWEVFLATWPPERIRTMKLEEYTNLSKSDSFCYWMESRTEPLGSIWGGSSYKFGIYKRDNTEKNDSRNAYLSDGEYAWLKKYGPNAETAFQTVKEKITAAVEAASSDNLPLVDTIKLGPAFKWKIAAMYHGSIPHIYKPQALNFLISNFKLDASTASEKYKALASLKSNNEDMVSLSERLWKVYDDHKSANENDLNLRAEEIPYKEKLHIPLNQILYGPPGTGKTYHTISKAVAVANPKFDLQLERSLIKEEFSRLVLNGQIVFTTFHQSMSYEDFVEGIKPLEPKNEGDPLIYKVEEGIFQKLCIDAAFSVAQQNKSAETERVLDFSVACDQFIDQVQETLSNGNVVDLKTRSGGKVLVVEISAQGNFIVKHPEGTTTYTVSKARLSKIAKEVPDLNRISTINTEFRDIIGGSNASAYWAVLNAIRGAVPLPKPIKERLSFSLEDKKEAIKAIQNEDYRKKGSKNFVLIIDEINRGNISQIFGELITLIEEDKRAGGSEALEVILPYSKEKFSVPSNLFIIGTMNTADRSVEALDSALRRRFSFQEMPPIPELISPERMIWNLWWNFPGVFWGNEPYQSKEDALFDLLEPEESLNEDKADIWESEMENYGRREEQTQLLKPYQYGLDLCVLLTTINNRIEILLDKDHQIGHSYFLSVDSVVKLKEAFHHKVIPLLQEYFYGDFGKIGLVLGQGFVEKHKSVSASVFATFDHEAVDDFAERPVYRIHNAIKMTDIEFKKALADLMGNQ